MAPLVSPCTPVDNPVRAIAFMTGELFPFQASNVIDWPCVAVEVHGSGVHGCDDGKPCSGRDCVSVIANAVTVQNIDIEDLTLTIPSVDRCIWQVFAEFFHDSPCVNTLPLASLCNGYATAGDTITSTPPAVKFGNLAAGLRAGGSFFEGA